ncbi:MAG: TIGR04282 family arsenosugar biosynthesis glycosyltransferase [Myxococcota bacterium]
MSTPADQATGSYGRPSRRGAILVFAKAPRSGLVKTRMSPPLSLDEAAELYAHMLDDVLVATAEIAALLDLAPVLVVHPGEACAELADRAPKAYRIIPQRGRDLAERMTWAMAELASGGISPILLRGSDSPVLGEEIVRQAVEALESNDLVLCPDLDGGYNLVGLRSPAAGLFDHPMSTETVLEDTLASARTLGLRANLLPPSFDLDTAADLAELARLRGESTALLCPRTIAYLDERDLWRHLG